MNYGKAIRVARSLADISQRELALSLGSDPSYISILEGNKREPSRKILERIAEALHVPLHLLILMATEQQDTKQPEEQRLSEIGEALAGLLFTGDEDDGKQIGVSKPRQRKQVGAKVASKRGATTKSGPRARVAV